MNYYFLDYENVHADGFKGAGSLKENDVVCVMYTDQSRNVTFDIIEEINSRGARIESYRAGTGSKNALDFQLSSYLGYVIGKNEKKQYQYFIISEDTGYDRVVEFWKGRGFSIKRMANLSGSQGTKPSPSSGGQGSKQQTQSQQTGKTAQPRRTRRRSRVAEENLATEEELRRYLDDEEYSDSILEIINTYKSKQAINNALTKECKDTKKGGAIYKKLKSLLKEKKKS